MLFILTARHDALFVVGPLDETMILRGMRYHPVDIENTVTRCHRAICERFVLYSPPDLPPSHVIPRVGEGTYHQVLFFARKKIENIELVRKEYFGA